MIILRGFSLYLIFSLHVNSVQALSVSFSVVTAKIGIICLKALRNATKTIPNCIRSLNCP